MEKDIIFKGKKELKLIKSSNFDWAEDYANQNFISRFIIIFNRRLTSYTFKK